MNENKSVIIIGGGLAGAEAAWQAAISGIEVILIEMRPINKSPAHHTDEFAELVCSNSFGALSSDRAAGLLKQELRELNSLVIETADRHSVPAGGALAVDRSKFSAAITEKLYSHPHITVKREELKSLPSEKQLSIIATGPLTGECLANDLKKFTGEEECHFYDAASPIISGESIDFSIAFPASRYDKGDSDYLNCPMNESEYKEFRKELMKANQSELKDFEKDSAKFFEGCLPIEELARRGEDTMRYGPLKPIGIWDPRWGDLYDPDIRKEKRAYAIVQLRKEDKQGQLWNLVGFQTNLKWEEQKRVFKMIPGLKNADFIRLGVMHRNTFLESPKLLKPTLQFKKRLNLLAAGQITGTEGYATAVAGGWIAGINAALIAKGEQPITLPSTTMMGALTHFVSGHEDLYTRSQKKGVFQPMPANFGILPKLPKHLPNKRARYSAYRDRALAEIYQFKRNLPKSLLKDRYSPK
ncbi:FADH(2)-oxidizing methylenetetrahydrofolate--tRNA-(uracil(54)-C(5))-methyltransferase TrmFO [Prochlorococcus sp. MIT 1223]|uniref:FADH(2)-oxidizing methylenetetrahydrofolate--tRNA-(uracil(54)-C(5))- methyltransferase TrmFO n=1 Tax=Prochlorococcus sp. MIT 1223 TaxID=3096217 RepID=UPI002A756616|nr:FADH(2)-oxidizing methylenetetrahydrofolate--tRNA-(uracil(54)-C(5))-methyltransferase TrmFO [Prochlorococcus sp. MIT 1223]